MEYVVVPPERLPADVLHNLMEDFIAREGTDYGADALEMDEKVARLTRELARGAAVIVYDPEQETCNIIPARDLPG